MSLFSELSALFFGPSNDIDVITPVESATGLPPAANVEAPPAGTEAGEPECATRISDGAQSAPAASTSPLIRLTSHALDTHWHGWCSTCKKGTTSLYEPGRAVRCSACGTHLEDESQHLPHRDPVVPLDYAGGAL